MPIKRTIFHIDRVHLQIIIIDINFNYFVLSPHCTLSIFTVENYFVCLLFIFWLSKIRFTDTLKIKLLMIYTHKLLFARAWTQMTFVVQIFSLWSIIVITSRDVQSTMDSRMFGKIIKIN